MKAFLFLSILTLSLTAIASQNEAPDCERTMHGADRGNPKEIFDSKPSTSSEQGQGASSL
jgi:hypothetical protein